jgi:lipopolysaccharide export system protein LptA
MATAIRTDRRRGRLAGTAALGLALALLTLPVLAQEPAAGEQPRATGSGNLPDSFANLGVGQGGQIEIEAESLEVRDQDQMAVFSGAVVARQDETVLRADRLEVYYVGEPGAGAQDISRLEAVGSVLLSSGGQTASGDQATFDNTAQTITLSGNVVLTQGQNVIRGPMLVINLGTGQAAMQGGRVQMLIEPSQPGG